MPASASLRRDGPRNSIFVILLLLSAIFIFRIEFFLRTEHEHSLLPFANTTAVIEGVVANDPEQRESAVHVYVDVETLNGAPAQGRILALLPRDTEIFYNDHIEMRGLLEKPEAFETDTGRVFDYPGYLRVRGISVIMRHAQVREVSEGDWSLRGTLFAFKHSFEASLERLLPEPRAALMEGVLLGERRGLPDALTDAFVIAGLIHIVVLSGYNISIVSETVLRFFSSFLSRASALALGGSAIVLFALLTGGGAATVRACIMGLIAVLARYLRRPAAALRALGIAAILMALWNPLVILYDPGFILSVIATFGLITLSPYVEKHLTFMPNWKRFNFRSIAASTIAVQLFVLPALLYMTGIFSLVSIPVNIITLPFVPLSMFLGFVSGLLGLAHPIAAFIPALGADILLRLVIAVAQGAASLPLVVIVPTFPVWVAAVLYVPLIVVATRLYQSVPQSPAN